MRDSIGRAILVPALVTLGVTALRLVGELAHGAPTLFSRAVGGGAALVGIVWLVPVFGALFARRLTHDGEAVSPARTAGFAALGLIVFGALAAAGFARPVASLSQFALIAAGAWLGILVARRGWPRLVDTLLAYGLAARIPVIVVILLGILNGWNTHYDSPPPGLPDLGPIARWIAIGVIPQLTIWMAFTAIVGALTGAAAVAFSRRPRPATA